MQQKCIWIWNSWIWISRVIWIQHFWDKWAKLSSREHISRRHVGSTAADFIQISRTQFSVELCGGLRVNGAMTTANSPAPRPRPWSQAVFYSPWEQLWQIQWTDSLRKPLNGLFKTTQWIIGRDLGQKKWFSKNSGTLCHQTQGEKSGDGARWESPMISLACNNWGLLFVVLWWPMPSCQRRDPVGNKWSLVRRICHRPEKYN